MYPSNTGSKWTSQQTPTNDAEDARYPSQWSDWEYNEQNKGRYRYRLKGPGDYEYDYSPGAASSVAGSFQPRTTQPMTTISTPRQSYSSYDSYTASDPSMDTLRQGFARATIGTGFRSSSTATDAPTWQAHSSWIRTKDPTTNKESFDPHYKVHKPAQFKTGRIFKVLWAEPQGNNTCGGSESTSNSVTVRSGKYGQEHYEKVRRFVIINPMSGHCICLPILTYRKQGVNKKGVHVDHHTIIYTGSQPQWLPGEYELGLTKTPIKVEPVNPRHKLDVASRLNYAKPYTVEYNVKVWFIGQVTTESYSQIAIDYNNIHPPLTSSTTNPLPTPQDTYSHATGGSNTSYASSFNPRYPSTYGPNRISYPAIGCIHGDRGNFHSDASPDIPQITPAEHTSNFDLESRPMHDDTLDELPINTSSSGDAFDEGGTVPSDQTRGSGHQKSLEDPYNSESEYEQ